MVPYPWFTTLIIGFLFYGFIAAVFSRDGKDCGWYMSNPFEFISWRVPFCLTAVYAAYAAQAGGVEFWPLVKFAVWIFAPAMLLWPAQYAGNKPTWWDALAILALWLPFDLHWVTRRQYAIKDALDWPIMALSAVILGIVFWVCQRRLEGTKMQYAFRIRDLGLVVAGLTFLFAAIIPLGFFATDFLKPAKFWETETAPSWSSIATHLFTKTFLIYVLKIFVTIGISEEFLFRGIIQNMLDRVMNKWGSLILASLLFGCAHLNNGAKSWYPGDWNWTYAMFASIAGLAYGTVFRYSSSILYAILLHSLVDAIWHTFFR